MGFHCCHRPPRRRGTAYPWPRWRWAAPCREHWPARLPDPNRVVCATCGHTVACHLRRYGASAEALSELPPAVQPNDGEERR